MKESIYKNYDDLPLFLNADLVAKVLGISAASSYELMHEKDFPVLKIGNRMVVPKEKFVVWVEQQSILTCSTARAAKRISAIPVIKP